MADGTNLWTRINLWLRSLRLQQLTQERFLKTTWATLFRVGAIAVFLDIWQDGVILVKGVPVLTTLGATLFAVTLSPATDRGNAPDTLGATLFAVTLSGRPVGYRNAGTLGATLFCRHAQFGADLEAPGSLARKSRKEELTK